jgi:hypothetical protein
LGFSQLKHTGPSLLDETRCPVSPVTPARRLGGVGRVALAAIGLTVASNAAAQLIQPAPGPTNDRSRNVSVTERSHPEYEALGIRVQSFIVNAQLAVAPAFSDNVFTDNSNRVSDAYVTISPQTTIASNWSMHEVRVTAAANLQRYAQQTLRNQDPWYIYADGRFDASRNLKILVSGQLDQGVESPFSGDLVANLTVPSKFLRTLALARVIHDGGLSRISGSLERQSFKFDPIEFGGGVTRDQRERDRVIYRGSAIFEHALAPSLAFYGQLVADKHSFSSNLQNGAANLDSTGLSVIGGANFDLAGFMRGSIGVGYSQRNFRAKALYPTAKGISVQAKVEFFASPITTFRATAQRQLQDFSLGDGFALWDTRFGVGVDHELLRNLILSADAQIGNRSYLVFDGRTDIFDISATGRYQASRSLGFTGNVRYGSSSPNLTRLGNPFNQFTVSGGVVIRI